MSFKDYLSKIPFLQPKEEKHENYFGLQVSYHKVIATVWTIRKNSLVVLNSASATFDNDDEFKSEKSLAALADAANYCLDEALADIMPEPTQLLFGVPESWLHMENIKPEYLKILKKLVHELDVTPMAYVSTAHAIAHLLQKQQGVPLTAILVEVADPLVVNVLKAGKTQATVIQVRGGNIGKDIEQALATIDTIEVLPSKMLLYGSDNLDKIKDDLSTHSWMSQLPFLHLPRVDNLPASIAAQAICFAGGSELFPNITSQIVDYSQDKVQTPKLSHKVELEDTPRPTRAGRVPVEAVEAGFIEDDGEEKAVDDKEFTDEETGILAENEWEEEEENAPQLPARQQVVARSGGMQDKLLAPFMVLARGGGKFKFVIIGVVIVIALILLAIFFTHAKVTIYVDMKTITNTSEVVADPAITSVDQANKAIPGKVLDTQESGSDKGTATGTKKVGDPAKGTVVIYNKTDSPKTFAQGTVLIGPSNLQFSLDSNIQVASQSAVEGGIAFGKTTANATAANIGPEGNLPAGTVVTIKGQATDQYSAQVDQAFAGGVSKDVTVVTANDQKVLLAKVSSELKTKAQQDLQGKLTGDQKLQAEGFVEKIIKSTYSKNVGDQTADFTLTLNGDYKGTAYSDSDLKTILTQFAQVNNPDPSKYKLDTSKVDTQADVEKIDAATGKLYFNAKLNAQLMPIFNTDLIQKQIAGKTKAQAESQLQNLENVVDTDIVLSPSLPGPLARLPFIPGNISITVTTK